MAAIAPMSQQVYGTAKRLRHNVETLPRSIVTFADMVVMLVVVCGDCGQRYALTHRRHSQDATLAERQAAWLRDRFVWDHIQEHRHAGCIRLLGPDEMKPAIPAR
jgi:hypothetical protein